MRTLIKFIISLIIAVGICGILLFTGILKLDSKSDNTETKSCQTAVPETGAPPAGDKAHKAKDQTPEKENQQTQKDGRYKQIPNESVTASPGEKLEPGEGETENAPDEKAPRNLTNKTKSGDMPVEQQAVGMALATKNSYEALDADTYQQALSYLYFLAKDQAGNTQSRFSRFLRTEFDLTDKTIDQIMQMTFWKNFLVFQKKWSSGDANALKQAFDREVDLKKAGFEAMGIKLMNAEINAAKSRLSDLQKQLAQGSGIQTRAAEQTP